VTAEAAVDTAGEEAAEAVAAAVDTSFVLSARLCSRVGFVEPRLKF